MVKGTMHGPGHGPPPPPRCWKPKNTPPPPPPTFVSTPPIDALATAVSSCNTPCKPASKEARPWRSCLCKPAKGFHTTTANGHVKHLERPTPSFSTPTQHHCRTGAWPRAGHSPHQKEVQLEHWVEGSAQKTTRMAVPTVPTVPTYNEAEHLWGDHRQHHGGKAVGTHAGGRGRVVVPTKRMGDGPQSDCGFA